MSDKAYHKFRTGSTFADVREILQHEADARYHRGDYMFISRPTVLGRWREIKLGMFKRARENWVS